LILKISYNLNIMNKINYVFFINNFNEVDLKFYFIILCINKYEKYKFMIYYILKIYILY
jgi:hypothetical protein